MVLLRTINTFDCFMGRERVDLRPGRWHQGLMGSTADCLSLLRERMLQVARVLRLLMVKSRS